MSALWNLADNCTLADVDRNIESVPLTDSDYCFGCAADPDQPHEADCIVLLQMIRLNHFTSEYPE